MEIGPRREVSESRIILGSFEKDVEQLKRIVEAAANLFSKVKFTHPEVPLCLILQDLSTQIEGEDNSDMLNIAVISLFLQRLRVHL